MLKNCGFPICTLEDKRKKFGKCLVEELLLLSGRIDAARLSKKNQVLVLLVALDSKKRFFFAVGSN